MFEDENRPLYKLCWKMTLQKIAAEHYFPHIQKAAKLAWKNQITRDVFDSIMHFSDRHPFYVNKLCDRLWTHCKQKAPTLHDIEKNWRDIVEEDKSDAIKDIAALSLGQKKVLQQIANHPNAQLTSKETILSLEMTSSSIMSAVTGLEEKDVIDIENSHYHIINPIVKSYAAVQ